MLHRCVGTLSGVPGGRADQENKGRFRTTPYIAFPEVRAWGLLIKYWLILGTLWKSLYLGGGCLDHHQQLSSAPLFCQVFARMLGQLDRLEVFAQVGAW